MDFTIIEFSSDDLMKEIDRQIAEIEMKRAIRKAQEPQEEIIITQSEYDSLCTILNFLEEQDLLREECLDLCDLLERV